MKQYYENGKILYDGEHNNWIWNGFGKEYYKNGRIKYEGEFSDGKWNGKGKEYFQNGKIDGEYLNGNKVNVKNKRKKIIQNLKSNYQ